MLNVVSLNGPPEFCYKPSPTKSNVQAIEISSSFLSLPIQVGKNKGFIYDSSTRKPINGMKVKSQKQNRFRPKL